MWGPGGFACIVSFICHIPSGMVGINGLSDWKNAKDLGDIYDVIPHGRVFLQGLQFSGIAVRALPSSSHEDEGGELTRLRESSPSRGTLPSLGLRPSAAAACSPSSAS
jgi:hypothetical protein